MQRAALTNSDINYGNGWWETIFFTATTAILSVLFIYINLCHPAVLSIFMNSIFNPAYKI
jgi:hypothetical protein